MSLAFDESAEESRTEFGPFRLEAHASGIALLWFDDPDRKVNLLDSEALASLRRVLDALRQRTDPAFPTSRELSIWVSMIA